jgi:hypothetical protein
LGSPSRPTQAKTGPNRSSFRAERHAMIHPSLIAIAALVVVFGILNLIEFKRID